ncbi:hypothetical protein [Pseudorhodoplanes sinuspersici]|nr:hypothetical protein [Pseudorhodoplanes sinuspersici]
MACAKASPTSRKVTSRNGGGNARVGAVELEMRVRVAGGICDMTYL